MKHFLIFSMLFLGSSCIQAMDVGPEKISEKSELADRTCCACLDEKDAREFVTLDCGCDKSCRGCLHHSVDLAIREQNPTFYLKCHSCSQPLTEHDIRIITQNDRETMEAVAAIQLKRWLAEQKNVHLCPTAQCSYHYLYEGEGFLRMTCPRCKKSYCANCGINHDARTNCEQISQLRELSSASRSWLREKVRLCPHCGVPIEKNLGCDHMHCEKCGTDFCFNCLQIGTHSTCPRIKAPIQTELARDMTWYQRAFHNPQVRRAAMITVPLLGIGALGYMGQTPRGLKLLMKGRNLVRGTGALALQHPYISLGLILGTFTESLLAAEADVPFSPSNWGILASTFSLYFWIMAKSMKIIDRFLE